MGIFNRIFRRFFYKEEDRTINDDYLPIHLPPASKDGDDYKAWIPFAENVSKTLNLKMKTRGEFKNGYPEGIVVHWTSGWHLPKGIHTRPFPITNEHIHNKDARKYAISALRYGKNHGYNYLTMDVLGKIYQSSPLTKHGYHAGKSYWPGLGHSVSRKIIGIEILNPSTAKLKNGKYYTWFNYILPDSLIRSTKKGNFYEYSVEQEESLFRLCVWLYENSPVINGNKVFKIKNIIGHDECAPNRKSDPGDSLSMSMECFRDKVRDYVLKKTDSNNG